MGGNAVLLIDGPVSELGDPCCKNWTTADMSFHLTGRRQCILYAHSMHVLIWVDVGVTCHSINNNYVS